MSDAPGPALRIADADRERAADRLKRASAEGRLTLDEADERLAAAYAARTAEDLRPLLADLPADPVPNPRRRPSPGLRRHAAVVVVVSVLLTLAWAGSGTPFFWPAWPIAFLVLSLVRHARAEQGGRQRWGDVRR